MTDIEFLGEVLTKGIELGTVLSLIYGMYLGTQALIDWLCADEG